MKLDNVKKPIKSVLTNTIYSNRRELTSTALHSTLSELNWIIHYWVCIKSFLITHETWACTCFMFYYITEGDLDDLRNNHNFVEPSSIKMFPPCHKLHIFDVFLDIDLMRHTINTNSWISRSWLFATYN